jgi:hypothetical protein
MFEDGAIVGSYQIAAQAGRGGMGAVFAGEHTLLGRGRRSGAAADAVRRSISCSGCSTKRGR